MLSDMTKILFNDKKIFLTDNYNDLQNDLKINNSQVIFGLDKQKLLHCIDLLMISEIEHAVFVGKEEELLDAIKKCFKVIVAGGGLVMNERNEILFIYRRGKWDLPKGKIEPGEEIEICALREVMEETGIENLEILYPLSKTYHIYFENEFVFKETCWFLMQSNDTSLKPQTEEGIKKAVWINKKNLAPQLKNTFESIRDIVAAMIAKTA